MLASSALGDELALPSRAVVLRFDIDLAIHVFRHALGEALSRALASGTSRPSPSRVLSGTERPRRPLLRSCSTLEQPSRSPRRPFSNLEKPRQALRAATSRTK